VTAVHANSALALRKAALAGLGIALLPEYSIAADLAAGTLVRVLPQHTTRRPSWRFTRDRRTFPEGSPADRFPRTVVQARTLGTVDMNDKADRKVAVVTGGGRGLGAAMALGLARAGYRVVVTAAREARKSKRPRPKPATIGSSARRGCHSGGGLRARGRRRSGAVRSPTFWSTMPAAGMKYISSSFMTEPTRFWEADASAWRSVIDTNINGPF